MLNMELDNEAYKIASCTSLGLTKEFNGPVIAMRDAIFCVLALNASKAFLKLGMGAIDGIESVDFANENAASDFGDSLRNAFSATVAEATTPFSVPLADIPVYLRENWPILLRKSTGQTSVLVIPRESVIELRYPWWASMTVKTSSRRITIAPSFPKRGKIIRFLTAHGWRIE